jgi:hypothetical protein
MSLLRLLNVFALVKHAIVQECARTCEGGDLFGKADPWSELVFSTISWTYRAVMDEFEVTEERIESPSAAHISQV